ncbi:RagB/SusD family nutrient uptake outer membrane protein [Algibacter sp. L1A34]|uniref:RagB/SusD family nutrient uptake outer membrane protein n=1 Tax=Algibacter sp. L1A34 TaxID=2686365 RepID=UPI00131BD9B1|nr:RagB/SusD family nutrient uptake outer membrane protein [Algibacter sp. L1A34]
MKQYRNITFSIILGLTLFTSCDDLLDVDPEEVLLTEDYLGASKIETRSALFGVLSQLQDVAGQYVVLGELRGDLTNVNASTNDELREINNHAISADNSYADLTTIFSIINNCNFALEGIDKEAFEGDLLDDYAGILRIRTWAQMQILINYGKLPYITVPIKTSDELDDTYPLLSIDEALDQLIRNLAEVEGVDNVTDYAGSEGFSVYKMIPDQHILLGDLYLWKGNYELAATNYKLFLDEFSTLSTNRISVTENNGKYTYNPDGWADIFGESPRSTAVIDYVAFSEQYRQPNSSFEVITAQMQASTSIIANWNSQSMGYEGLPVVDNLDERAAVSATIEDVEPLILKYQYEYFTWNRVAKIYLRYAEAINYAGYPEQALVVINGIFNNPNVDPIDAPIFFNEEEFLNFDEWYYLFDDNEPIIGNLGVRGRASLAPVGLDIDMSNITTAMDEVGALILNEAALELAFEGNRWEDLMRYARRDSDASILADAIADKFITAGDAGTGEAIRAKLLNPDNWYLPYTIPDNFVSE